MQERREQKIAEKNESREAVPRAGVETNTAVKDAGKVERKAVAQKKTMPEKEKKPSIHERLEINKRIIQEKQGKDKPERGVIIPGLSEPPVRTLRFFRNYPLLLLYPMYLNFASSNCLPHLPYIVRFIIFNLLLVPSTNPLL